MTRARVGSPRLTETQWVVLKEWSIHPDPVCATEVRRFIRGVPFGSPTVAVLHRRGYLRRIGRVEYVVTDAGLTAIERQRTEFTGGRDR